jgi:hypothetical protein
VRGSGIGIPSAADGPFVVRWKIDGRHRALARRTVGYNGANYIEHLGLRVIHAPRSIKRALDSWEQNLRENV